MGIRKIDLKLCIGCNVCVDVCPLDVIRMEPATNKAYIKYLRDCQSCFLCEVECPEDAIEVVAVHERRMVTAW
jgi:NAD-dependent dihydropyrimidine dehydrogenase PreA subunit